MRRELLPWLAFVAMVLIWGTSFLAIRVGNQEGYPPLAAGALRLVLAALVLLVAARLARIAWPRGRDLRVALVVGLCYFGINLPLLYWSELTINSSTGAVIWGIYPLFVAIGGHLALRGQEPLTPATVVGGVLALLGLALVFREQLDLGAPLLGFAAVLGGVTASTVGTMLQKRWGTAMHPIMFNGLGVLAGAVLLVPAALLLERGFALPPTPLAWGTLLFLLVTGSLIAFPLWSWVLQRWPATRLSYQTVLSPIVAVIAGATLLAEPVEPGFLAGTALVLLGTWLAARPRSAVASPLARQALRAWRARP